MAEILKIKKLLPAAKLPTRGTAFSAGLDLYVAEVTTRIGENIYDSGIAAEIPEGFVGLLFMRSSVYKQQQTLRNAVGVIDSDYRGSITARFTFSPTHYKVGDRFAQLVIVPYAQFEPQFVDTLTDTERGEGGYGSTGL